MSRSIIGSSQWAPSAGFNMIHGGSVSPVQGLPLVWNTPVRSPALALPQKARSVQEQIHFLHRLMTPGVRAAVKIQINQGRWESACLQTQKATESRFTEAGDCSSEPSIPHKVELVLPPSTHYSPSQGE